MIVCETRNIEKEIMEDRPKCEFITKEINLNNGKVIKLPTKVSFSFIGMIELLFLEKKINSSVIIYYYDIMQVLMLISFFPGLYKWKSQKTGQHS